MMRLRRIGVWLPVLSLAALALGPTALPAGERAKAAAPAIETVDLFPAIEAKRIEVQLFPKDSTECNLVVTNKTGQPLSVRLPMAFAAVPVLAQFPPNPGNPNDQDSPQPLGIPGMNNNQRNGLWNVPNPQQNMPFPPGFMNVAAEKVGKVKLPAVCLLHGAPNPRPQIPYQIKPLESVTDKPGVAEVCALLGRGEVTQEVAQLAAWHLANSLSWEKIAAKRQKVVFGTAPTYSRDQLQAAKKLAEKAVDLAKQRKFRNSPSPTSAAMK